MSQRRKIQTQDRLLTLKEVMALIGFKKTFIYEKIAQGLFPSKVDLPTRAARWRESEVFGWMDHNELGVADA